MNKVITINLGGVAFQLEEGGYDALRAYLDHAAARLQGNPDRDEIISDIEQSIGEKFRGRLNSYKTVILGKEVQEVLAEMGPIEDDSAAGAADSGAASAAKDAGSTPPPSSAAGATSYTPKRLYRLREGEMIAGVCNGIGAYFNIDPTLVRLAFVLLTLIWGTGVLVYVIMAIVVPVADTAEEKAAASGAPFTAKEFVRRARAGYYDAMKNFPDRKARREWKRKFKQEMREWRTSFHREMAANSQEWRERWQRSWTPVHPGLSVALPVFSLVRAALGILFVCAAISLLATGGVFGLMPPASVPVWMALLVLLIAYGVLVMPLKLVRRACYYDLGGRSAWPTLVFAEMLVWLMVIVVVLWLGRHHLPQIHEAIHNVPTTIHQAVTDIRDWWNRA